MILIDDSFGVPGSVCHNKDDSYSIFINANLCYEKQREVFMHELRHVLCNDFEKDDVQMLESENHQCDYKFNDELCTAI